MLSAPSVPEIESITQKKADGYYVNVTVSWEVSQYSHFNDMTRGINRTNNQ